MTVAAPAHPAPARSSAQSWHLIAAASIGNALEWFDLLVYGYFAVIISQVFFPAENQLTSLLLTLGTFGASYLVRPLGAIVLGAYADRAGRKASLLASILLMMIGTLLMVVMPSYASIGVLAPIFVLFARLMQGFSVGGEFGSSTAFLVEHGPDRKGFFASWQWSGQGLAAVLASAFGVVLSATLSPEQLQSWGWRIPFVFGLLIGPIGFYIRRHVEETPEFLAAEPAGAPLREVLTRQWDRLLLAIGAVMVSTSSNYLILYMPTYAIKQLNLPAITGFIATLIGGIVLTLCAPVAGHWSDKVGRTGIMLATSALFLVTAYPAFAILAAHPSLAILVLVVGWLSLVKAAYSGVLPALMAELFPTRTRGTGMALSYNISVPLFGGFAPFIATSLIALTGDNLAPSFYLMATAIVSLVVLMIVHRRFEVP
jgi:MHS family proline/betaine transporter-like MFS transporter